MAQNTNNGLGDSIVNAGAGLLLGGYAGTFLGLFALAFVFATMAGTATMSSVIAIAVPVVGIPAAACAAIGAVACFVGSEILNFKARRRERLSHPQPAVQQQSSFGNDSKPRHFAKLRTAFKSIGHKKSAAPTKDAKLKPNTFNPKA